VASRNRKKLAELRRVLDGAGVALTLLSLDQVAPFDEAPESGATFEENARIKARFYFERAHTATLADDGGLEIDALGGEPGVRSHRWLNSGVDDSDLALVSEVMRRMEDVPIGQRSARLRATTALIYDDGGKVRERVAEAAIEGVIAERAYPILRAGFPYRAVLFMPERNCFVGELGDEEEAKISQRRIALAKLHDDLARIAAGGGDRL